MGSQRSLECESEDSTNQLQLTALNPKCKGEVVDVVLTEEVEKIYSGHDRAIENSWLLRQGAPFSLGGKAVS